MELFIRLQDIAIIFSLNHPATRRSIDALGYFYILEHLPNGKKDF